MAALHIAPDSSATQLEPAEDGSECDADPEEEEEEEQQEEDEEEEEVVVEVATPVQKVAEVEVEANSADNGGVDDDGDDDDVEEMLAEEQTLSLGTQERPSNGGDAKAPVLQGKGKNGDPAASVEAKRLGL